MNVPAAVQTAAALAAAASSAPEAEGYKTDGAIIAADDVRHQVMRSNTFKEKDHPRLPLHLPGADDFQCARDDLIRYLFGKMVARCMAASLGT